MAEFCRNCFIKINNVDKDLESNIVLSNVKDYCERCCSYDYFVRYYKDPQKRMACHKNGVKLCENTYTNKCGNCKGDI